MSLLRPENINPGAHPLEGRSSTAGSTYRQPFEWSLSRTIWTLLLLAGWLPCAAQSGGQRSLELVPASAREATVVPLKDGVYEITATGANPSVSVMVPDGTTAEKGSVLAFEYFSAHADDHVHIEFGERSAETHVVHAAGLSHSEAFTTYSTDLNQSKDWRGKIGYLRIGFDAAPGRVIRLKNLVLRPSTAEETARAGRLAEQRANDERLRIRLEAYLHTSYAEEIGSVLVGSSLVHIEGLLKEDATGLYLAEVPLYQDVTDLQSFDFVTAIVPEGHRFRVDLTRFRTLPNGRYDRLLSKWVLVRKTTEGYRLASHARYADEVEPKWNLPDEEPKCKKGLGGVSAQRPLSDLDDLGVCSITVNIFLGFLHSVAHAGDIAFSYNGKDYFADGKAIKANDQTLQYAASRHIIVSAILLVPQARGFSDALIGSEMAHPDADPAGVYAMPNVSTAKGLETYAAALNFLAERYSRPDAAYGRIHHWIMHNEVDAGWVWTNAGEKSRLTFMDLYNKSMRTMYLIARQYNPHAKVFISLTHFWNWTEDAHFYLPKQMLDDLVQYSHAEGDYEWALACHPYPESLFKPRTWEDTKVSFSLDTPLITFKNIEVLNAWAQQPTTFFRGIKRRSIFLSEQGFNSPDYTERSLTDQAAAMAYAWKKIERLDAIEAMQYHNWVDNSGEGGLRIGLRKFPEDVADPLGRKPIWFLYQKLGTPEEDKASAFALPVIGIKSWNEIAYTGPIHGLEAAASSIRDVGSDTWTATDALGRKLPGYTEVGPPKSGRYVAMFYFLTHGSPGQPGPRDVSRELKTNPDTSRWPPGTYYWGEPEAGYYLSTDEWVIRHHATLLADAGVDVIVFDTTNDVTYPATYQTIASVFSKMRAEGEKTPQIAFLASYKSINQLWTDLYSKGLYRDLWFQWKGRPLLLTGQQIGMKRPDELPQAIQDFFTIRQSWAWDSLPWYRDGHDQWPWVAHTPQAYGWSESPTRPEAVSVAVAEHPLSDIGRSFHNGHEPATDKFDVTPETPNGLFFQEQWDHAIALDPEIVFVTGWNEWTAGSMRAGTTLQKELAAWDFFPGAELSRAGHPIHSGDLYFIDQYNEEFSRDIEPMKGGHTDNYYYQLVANIRRYKGVHAMEPSSVPQTIDLKASFEQWAAVTPEFRDHLGDTVHRSSPGNYQSGPYSDATGRNDIIAAKVTRDTKNIYFYAETRVPLTTSRDNGWMLLYIDSDQNATTGWQGYDFVIDAGSRAKGITTLQTIDSAGKLGSSIKLDFRLESNKVMIAIPRDVLHQTSGAVKLDFHWIDNVLPSNDPASFFIHGDAAPERRFNYRYEAVD